MWLRIWLMLSWVWPVYSQLHATAVTVEYIIAGRYSSVLLKGFKETRLPKGTVNKWSLVLRHRHTLIVIHTVGSSHIRYSDYYINRINYHKENGSLVLNNVDLDDRGVYENSVTTYEKTVQKSYYKKILDVLDILAAPLILQHPVTAVKVAQLICVSNSWNTDSILWFKGSKPLENNEIYSMSSNNRTLTIKTDQVQNCELYTCVIKNKISESMNTRMLSINGLVLLNQYSFISAIIALVSTTTTFAASVFIIFFALGTYRVHKRHVQLTAFFVFFQLLSFITLLFASLFCIFDPEFPIAYRIIESFGFLMVVAMVVYILVVYLHPETKLQRSFLIKRKHRYVFLAYGILSMFIAATPIYRAHYNIKICQFPVIETSGTAVSAAMAYIFISWLIFIMFIKHSKCSF
ncbi:uncharacterized protein LOC129693966 [Leucoraja erinacea]|uniref:uncharacterized protein LOC129693966 n=1 Tax=Leucoraja erinaceus TaxID=7782 RepID=UPI002456CF4D|nr:uncharacterized protein LOC129693966 [Leucoraja erinacea]